MTIYRRMNGKSVTLEEFSALKRIERLRRKIRGLPRARRKQRRLNLEEMLMQAEAKYAALRLGRP